MTGLDRLGRIDDPARLLGEIIDHVPALIAYWDRDQRNVVANSAYGRWFGFALADMAGKHLREVLGEDLYAQSLLHIERVLGGAEQSFDRTIRDAGRRVRHTHVSYVPDVVEGRVRGFFVLVTDTTAVRRREARDAALRGIALAAAGGAGQRDLLDLVADSMIELFEAARASVVRFTEAVTEFVTIRPPLDPNRLRYGQVRDVEETAGARVRETGRAQLVRYSPASTGLAAQMYAAGATIGASAPIVVNGRLWGAVGVGVRGDEVDGAQVLSELAEFADAAAASISSAAAWQALADLATEDPLTGLANRRRFEERLAEEVESARRHLRPLSLVLIDLDHFKAVNDTYGHAAGDVVLVEAARRMRSVARVDELLARTGGDEFALLLSDTDCAKSAAAAERLRKVLGRPWPSGAAVTASIGAATGTGSELTGSRLTKQADEALYESKRKGRDSITVVPSGGAGPVLRSVVRLRQRLTVHRRLLQAAGRLSLDLGGRQRSSGGGVAVGAGLSGGAPGGPGGPGIGVRGRPAGPGVRGVGGAFDPRPAVLAGNEGQDREIQPDGEGRVLR